MTATDLRGGDARQANVPNGYYDELQVGDSCRSGGRTITEADLVWFSAWSGDYSALHTDAEWAKNGPFGQRIAHGALTLSIATGLEYTLMDTMNESPVVAFYGIDRVRFVKPVFIGDTLHLQGSVTELEAKDDTRGIVTVRQEVRNQRDETVLVLDKRTLRLVRGAAA